MVSYDFDPETSPTLEYEFDEENNEAHTSFQLGYISGDRSRVVLMFVGLICMNPAIDAYELIFGIREPSHVSGLLSDYDTSHATVQRFIPRDARAIVLDLVMKAIIYLVERTAPDVVFMQTAVPMLPVAAFNKYRAIEKVLLNARYAKESEETGDDFNTTWIFKKRLQGDAGGITS